jgi:hypothetical protein
VISVLGAIKQLRGDDAGDEKAMSTSQSSVGDHERIGGRNQ